MSPVARSRGHAGTALIVAISGVAVAITLAFLLAVLANRGTVEVNLGDDVFDAGQVERIAEEIDDRGPITYSDVAGGERDIIVQHLGDEPDTGWHAFDARPPGADRECVLDWRQDDREFVDPCSGRRYPADGEGVPQYEVEIREGRIEIDLNPGTE